MSYLDTTSFDSALYYPHSTEDPSLAISFGLDTASSFPTSINNHLSNTATSHDSPRSFPAYDPESPFNSPIVPIRTVGKDGRLKTKLMGVGTEGGYLTSPLIVGGKRMGASAVFSSAPTPDISLDSPASTPMATDDSFGSVQELGGVSNLSLSRAPSSLGMSGSVGPGIGIGIAGINDLQVHAGAIDEYDEDVEDTPRPRTATVAKGASNSQMPMSPSRPPRSEGPGGSLRRNPDASIGENSARPPTLAASKFVQHQFTEPPPAAQAQPPATGRRPKRNLTLKTLNKAKSCSALSPAAQASAYPDEPLTPVSSHSNAFVIPGVPFNSPLDGELVAQQSDPNAMPFSFADLYNFGLTVDSTVDDLVNSTDARKDPYTFANQLIGAQNGSDSGGNGLGIGIGLGMGPNGGYSEEHDYTAVHSLPTPYLAHGSGFSTPATDYLNDVSPDMYRSPSHYSSVSMATAPSMMSAASMDSQYPTQQNGGGGGRQRCSTYQPSSGNTMQPSASSTMQHRQLSSTSAYGPSAKFAYPTRFVQGQQQAPAMQWANSVPPGSTQQQLHQTFVRNSHRNGDYSQGDTPMFIPQYHDYVPASHEQQSRHQRANEDAYERNLEAFDELYGRFSGPTVNAASVYATPGKRRRELDDEDEREYDMDGEGGLGDFDYVPGGVTESRPNARQTRAANAATPENSQSTHKRLRTVASAPCLPTRRLRPGPKPKTRSPGQQHESVFRTDHLSPPPMPYRRGTSPLDASPRRTGGATSDDEDEDGRPKGSLPKEVIQSLYNGIPSHMENGVKVSKRYECLMEGCGRTFPRKSAIESHIQTHLEDKPFVCSQSDW